MQSLREVKAWIVKIDNQGFWEDCRDLGVWWSRVSCGRQIMPNIARDFRHRDGYCPVWSRPP